MPTSIDWAEILKTLSTQFQIELSFTPSEIRGYEIDIRYFCPIFF